MKNKILIVMTFLAGTLLFNSCLKDKLNTDWTDSLSGKMYAQILNAGFQSYTITNAYTDQIIPIKVNIATDALPSSDITLTLAIDAAALTAYNAANSKSYIVSPNTTVAAVTIKAGTRTGTAYITLKSANLLDLTKSYAIPVSITSTGSTGVMIASNFKTVILQIPIANQWEGFYQSTGVFNHPVNGPRNLNLVKQYTTVDATSVTGAHSDLGGNGYKVLLKINADNTVVVTQYDASGTVIGEMVPGAINNYVPATKVFNLNYRYSGTGGFRVVQETLTFLHR